MSTVSPTAPKSHLFLIFISAVAALSGILFGYDTGVISGAILFISEKFHLSATLNGIVVSSVLLGALLGAAISGRLTDRWGRKKLLIADAVIFAVGTLLSALAPSISLLVVGRVIVGLAIGVASYVAPLYIGEIAPAKYRGALVSLNQLAITIGILISYIVDYHFADQGAWRWMLGVGLVPATLLFLGMLFLPDSPRSLISRGYRDKGALILHKIRQHPEYVAQELTAIENSLQHPHGTWKALRSALIRPALVIGIALAIIQQVTGINTIIYYAPTIFKLAGFHSDTTAILATMGVGVSFVLFTIIGLPLIDTVGRRILLMVGLAGMAISLLALSLAFHLSATHMGSVKWVALGSMIVYIACFAFSLGPIMWLMIAEIYPLKVRGLGSSIATCANWGSNMIVALTFLTLVNALGASGTFLVYFFISLGSLLFVYYRIPETRGVSLEQIENNLYAGLPSRDWGKH
ncbi:MAG: sugar porter family MFS transporter [Gammaproteobacteria bacterium]